MSGRRAIAAVAGRHIRSVAGNSEIGIERLAGQRVIAIFAWGKHLVFQMETFALRVHFMLWGTFAATVKGRSVTGDYRRSGPPRLMLNFANGEITIWSASVRFVEDEDAKGAYDFGANVMADEWDARAALAKERTFPRAEIADVLLDQAIFAGVGNIIKNEVLFRTRVSPFARVRDISDRKLKAIVADARTFSLRFLELRRIFALRKNLEVYGKSICLRCGGAIETARARPAGAPQLFLREVSGRTDQRTVQNADTTLTIRNEYLVLPLHAVQPSGRVQHRGARKGNLPMIFRLAFAVRARRVSSASRSSAASRARGRPGAGLRSDTRDNS